MIRLHVAAIDDDFRVCRAEAGNSSLIADVSAATHAFAEAKGCRSCREVAASDDDRRWVEGPAATWRLVMPAVRRRGAGAVPARLGAEWLGVNHANAGVCTAATAVAGGARATSISVTSRCAHNSPCARPFASGGTAFTVRPKTHWVSPRRTRRMDGAGWTLAVRFSATRTAGSGPPLCQHVVRHLKRRGLVNREG